MPTRVGFREGWRPSTRLDVHCTWPSLESGHVHAMGLIEKPKRVNWITADAGCSNGRQFQGL
ncbi:hypothetical protein PSEUDO8AS_30289 [Pseudomonas sp. 8AS]|nr:hypothetical protein PSEUDO8AS_30289 [Pseudomonas sp. 8AS]